MHFDLGPTAEGRFVFISLWKGRKVFVVKRRTYESSDKTFTLWTSWFNLSFIKALSTAGKIRWNYVGQTWEYCYLLRNAEYHHFLFFLQSSIRMFLTSPTVVKILGAIQEIVHKLFPAWDTKVGVCCSLQGSCSAGTKSPPLPFLMNWWGKLSSISLLSILVVDGLLWRA